MKLFKVRLSERYGCHMLFIRLSRCQKDETRTSLFLSIYRGIGYGIIYSFLALYNVQTFLPGNTLLTHCWSTVAWNCCYQTRYHDSWRNKLVLSQKIAENVILVHAKIKRFLHGRWGTCFNSSFLSRIKHTSL